MFEKMWQRSNNDVLRNFDNYLFYQLIFSTVIGLSLYLAIYFPPTVPLSEFLFHQVHPPLVNALMAVLYPLVKLMMVIGNTIPLSVVSLITATTLYQAVFVRSYNWLVNKKLALSDNPTVLQTFVSSLLPGLLAVGLFSYIFPTIPFNFLVLAAVSITASSLNLSNSLFKFKILDFNLGDKVTPRSILTYIKNQLLFVPFFLGNLISLGYLEKNLTGGKLITGNDNLKGNNDAIPLVPLVPVTPVAAANGQVYGHPALQPAPVIAVGANAAQHPRGNRHTLAGTGFGANAHQVNVDPKDGYEDNAPLLGGNSL